MATNVIPFRARPVNDNSDRTPPPSAQREIMRLSIMLDWWAVELREILSDRPARSSFEYRAWRMRLGEAQDRVSEFRDRIGRAA